VYNCTSRHHTALNCDTEVVTSHHSATVRIESS